MAKSSAPAADRLRSQCAGAAQSVRSHGDPGAAFVLRVYQASTLGPATAGPR